MNSLNLTATQFGGQIYNIEAYRSAFDKIIRNAIGTANESFKTKKTSGQQEHQIEIPIQIVTAIKEEQQQQTSATTTTDTREYTEKRPEEKEKN